MPEFEEKPVAGLPSDEELEAIKAENEMLKQPKGIPTMGKDAAPMPKNVDGTLKRPEQVLRETLKGAIKKKMEELTVADIVSLEREVRRYIKKGGFVKTVKGDLKEVAAGYRKGITEEAKKRCDEFLKRLGRVDKKGNPVPEWDKSINVPGFES